MFGSRVLEHRQYLIVSAGVKRDIVNSCFVYLPVFTGIGYNS